MRWWHALILAAGLAIAGVGAGGIWEVRWNEDGNPWRFNRFTGAWDMYHIQKGGMGWLRMPNRAFGEARVESSHSSRGR